MLFLMQSSRMWSCGDQVCLCCRHLKDSVAAAGPRCHCIGALMLHSHCGQCVILSGPVVGGARISITFEDEALVPALL